MGAIRPSTQPLTTRTTRQPDTRPRARVATLPPPGPAPLPRIVGSRSTPAGITRSGPLAGIAIPTPPTIRYLLASTATPIRNPLPTRTTEGFAIMFMRLLPVTGAIEGPDEKT